MDGNLSFFDKMKEPDEPETSYIIVDNFAGGGGASSAIERALGRSPDYAINHDPVALSMHEANHPQTKHLTTSIWAVDPRDIVRRGQKIGLAWFSPDCKHHSKAKGGKPVNKNIRDLAWVVVSWAELVSPEVIILENVEEFKDWGPLTPDNKPDPKLRGETFKKWLKALRSLGYKVEYRELRACDYGDPTIRKRLFVIARRDGEPIVWPNPTHGAPDSQGVIDGNLKAWRTAADIIDWSIPCPSIFDTSEQIKEKYGVRAIRPLAENTLKRIAKGVQKYVINSGDPFFVSYAQHGGASRSASGPMHTITASPKDQNAIVTAFLAQHNTQRDGVNPGRDARGPMATITARGTQINVVSAHIQSMHGTSRRDRPAGAPVQSLTAGGGHAAIISAFMTKYYGSGESSFDVRGPAHTLTTRDRFNLVTCKIEGSPYYIADIGMRMLTPREMFLAQGFPPDYEIDTGHDGRILTKTEKTRMCGNSVPPGTGAALCAANAMRFSAVNSRVIKNE